MTHYNVIYIYIYWLQILTILKHLYRVIPRCAFLDYISLYIQGVETSSAADDDDDDDDDDKRRQDAKRVSFN